MTQAECTRRWRAKKLLEDPDYFKRQYRDSTKKKEWEKQDRLKRRLLREPGKLVKCPKCNIRLHSYNYRYKAAYKKHLEEFHSY